MKFNQLALLFSLCVFALGSVSVSAQKQPNIILILADDLGYGDLGVYGQTKIHTPNIDALAAGGMRFTNYYSGSTVCAPSRETLLTGMHTGHTYIRGNFLTDQKEDPAMPSEKVTIAEHLKKAGYQTALFGKWGLGGEGHGPETQGFDSSYCYLDQIQAHNYYPTFLYHNGNKVEIEENKNEGKGVYSHHVFVDKTLEYINGRSKKNPFFLYLPYTIPHGKYQLAADTPYTSKDWSEQYKVYATMISLLDRDIGRIIALLKQKGLYDNSIILLASDNGANAGFARFFNSNGNFKGSKTDFYEGGIHVPLIASWKGKIKAGQTSSHITASWDFLPTLFDVAGIKKPSDIDGISFMPTLLNKKQPEHDYLYWEFYEYNYNWNKPNNQLPRNYLDSKAIRAGKWKAVQRNMYKEKDHPVELYDLETDPSEMNNIAGSHPDVVSRMKNIFNSATVANSPFFPYKK